VVFTLFVHFAHIMQHIGSHFHHSYQREAGLEPPAFHSCPEGLAKIQKDSAQESNADSQSSIGRETPSLEQFSRPAIG
jgi:hypothetical protein